MKQLKKQGGRRNGQLFHYKFFSVDTDMKDPFIPVLRFV